MSIKVRKIDDSLNDLKFNLSNFDKVTYVRYGDNDIYHMIGKDQNGKKLTTPIGSNKTQFTPTLQQYLKRGFSIKHPQYMKAVTIPWTREPGMRGTSVFRSKTPLITRRYITLLTTETEFYHPVLFSFLACKRHDDWQAFAEEYIIYRDKIFVGCNNPNQMPQLGKFRDWVPTPSKNAPEAYTTVRSTLMKLIKPNDMIILGCGQLSRVLAGYLWTHDIPLHTIDIGSHIDGYVGKVTRKYLGQYVSCLMQSPSPLSLEERQD